MVGASENNNIDFKNIWECNFTTEANAWAYILISCESLMVFL
jgi:hypothetical protein